MIQLAKVIDVFEPRIGGSDLVHGKVPKADRKLYNHRQSKWLKIYICMFLLYIYDHLVQLVQGSVSMDELVCAFELN